MARKTAVFHLSCAFCSFVRDASRKHGWLDLRRGTSLSDKTAAASGDQAGVEVYMIAITTGRELLSKIRSRFTLVETGSDWPGFSDRRAEARYELQSGKVPVEVSSRYGLTARGLLADVSPSGARIITDYVPLRGEVLRLAFDLGGDRYVLDGEVRHMGVEGSIRFFGMSFID